ncbi:hypothetical protein PENVUL_c032G03451 [Penicillium vulpinum]|uniref:Uncharacterized protein n=1 Tax=Penicillium vulpinum TaxID=29845 RepID=A0A1V6RSL2_9EURO|nr:hypothetical protein PENVUL_c032G03451 [Penicillium vulpinum]
MTSSPQLLGLGVIGGVHYTPEALREALVDLKNDLVDKNAPFGVYLLIPKVGGAARKTNHDYSHGKLDELIEIIIESGAKLFVSAVGLPPKHVVKRFHKGGVLYMNMVGHPVHAQKAIENGADLICAQGGEGGGHTGDIPTVILIPAIAEAIKGQRSAFTGKDVVLIVARGLFNGQSLAASLMLGASEVWIGTRFILAKESGASAYHQKMLQETGFDDIIRTIIFSGRTMHVRATPYIRRWERSRRQELLDLQSQAFCSPGHQVTRSCRGVIANQNDLDTKQDDNEILENAHPVIMGKVAAVVNEILPAKDIVEGMAEEACEHLESGHAMRSKL